jgi:hypothetical protein
MRNPDFQSQVFPSTMAANASSSSSDAVFGPNMSSLSFSSRGMPSSAYPLGNLAYSSTSSPVVESSHAGMTAQSSVMAQMAALTDANGEQVLNNAEGEFLFVLDGADTIRRDTSMGAVHVYTLAGVNELLQKHANEESLLMRDYFEGTRGDRMRRQRQDREFITTPSDFSRRIKFFGVQLSSTQTTKDANWQLQKRAGVTVFPVIAEGRSPVANLWGATTERSEVGFLVRAFPENEIAGTKEALLHRAPLQVVPVVKRCGGGVPANPSVGVPTVQRTNRRSASSSSATRKRPRRTIDDAIREHEMTRHIMRGEMPPRRAQQENEMSNIHATRSAVRPASTISDAADLDRLTTTYTIYGLEARDSSNPVSVNPEGIYSSYLDTVWKGEVDIGDRKAHLFEKERANGIYIPVGFVQSTARGGLPPEASIRRAVFDPSGVGFSQHRSRYSVYLQIRT